MTSTPPTITRGKAMFCGIIHTPDGFDAADFFVKHPEFRRRTFAHDAPADPGHIECPREHLETLFTPEFINALYPDTRERLRHDRRVYAAIASWRRSIKACMPLFRAANPKEKADTGAELRIDYVDCFSFPDGIVIYVVCADLADMRLDTFMSAAADIRMVNFYDSPVPPSRNVAFTDEFLSLFNTAVEIACPGGRLSHDVFEGNRLYQYTAVRLASSPALPDGYPRRHLLIDMAMGKAFGCSAAGSTDTNRVAESYISSAYGTGGVEMYANWEALSCADSFIAVADSSLADWAFGQWDFQRFLIYLNTLLCKALLMKVSTESHQRNIDTRFEVEFLQLIRVVHPPLISYNELPQTLCDTMREAMGVSRHLEIIRETISRNAEKKRDALEQMQNYILFALTVLGIFEAINAFNTLATPRSIGWPLFIILAFVATISIIGIFKWRRYKRM